MKLRNKKTGEIEKICLVMSGNKIAVIVADMPLCGNSVLGEYATLAELNEEWEDYDEKAEKEAIEMLKQLSEAIDRMNANMAKICGNFTIFGKGKK